MIFLQVSHINRQEEGTDQLKDISFTQQRFLKLALAGATGSGKTTLLKVIAGLAQPMSGEVWFEGVRVLGPEEKLIPGHPRIAFMSQHFELRNHYRVEELLQMSNELSDEEANRIYKVCRIDHLLKRWTHQLSGGERQRITLAGLLVAAPTLLLLDEPYSNLDAIHKSILKTVITDISEQLKITCILVAHDPVDILSWADEVIVLQQGQIIQKGPSIKVYKDPVNEYSAALFGKYNIINDDLLRLIASNPEIKLNGKRFLRPEDFTIDLEKSSGLIAKVKKVSFMGSYNEILVNISGHDILVNNCGCSIKEGETVHISLS
jgi:ABC-type glutathione transport system ATPase component